MVVANTGLAVAKGCLDVGWQWSKGGLGSGLVVVKVRLVVAW